MASSKKTLYVGGLAEEVDRNMVKSMFLPFGDVIDVNLPIDYSNQKHKGFAFVEFQSPEDAADAIDNLDNSEMLGRTIRVNIAKPVRFKDSNNRPIWADDEYLRKISGEGTDVSGEPMADEAEADSDRPQVVQVDDEGDKSQT